MAGAAVLGRLTWLVAEVAASRTETPRVRTLELDVAGWAQPWNTDDTRELEDAMALVGRDGGYGKAQP